MSRVFLDTSYMLALELLHDQYHRRAVEHWRAFAKSSSTLITTSFVMDEIVTKLNADGHHTRAVKIGKDLLTSPVIQFVEVDEPLFLTGWDYFCARDDKSYSLTDCISFVLMAQRGIAEALTFDRHFEQAGFIRLPQEQ